MEDKTMKNNHTHGHDFKRPGFRWKVARLIAFGIGGVALAALFALVLGFVVQWLWNWLMPDIFGLKQISYWQAFGLVFLGRLLFGGFGHHGPHHPKKHFPHGHADHCKEYKKFWDDKGETAADELIKRAEMSKTREMAAE
jgi:hypothetical protein